MAQILLVDNVRDERRALAAALQTGGYEVHEAEDGTDALENLRRHDYNLVITEVLLNEIDGTAVVEYLAAQPQRPRIIAFTAGNSQIPPEMALLLVKGQVDAALYKPVTEAAILKLAGELLAA